MLGSTAAELLPIGDSGTAGPAVHDPGAPPPDAARREPPAVPPLVRGRDGALVVADRETAWPDLSLVIARRTTRRARIRSMTAPLRRRRP
jgi:hypothetical protein